jgi:hypothetical protein
VLYLGDRPLGEMDFTDHGSQSPRLKDM